MPNSNKSISYPAVKPQRRRRLKIKQGTRTIYRNRRYGRMSSDYEPFHANDTDALKPEVWARESVRVLTEQMIYGATIHRDFSPLVANFGETVHTRKPAELTGKRKQNDLDDVEDQDVSATDIEVKLNQHAYCSFIIGDNEQSKSFVDLLEEYLVPAMRGNSRMLDQVIAMQAYQFLDNVAGGLDSLTKSNGHDYLLDLREVFNDNKVGPENRWLGLASRSETELQKTELFKSAEKIGDEGTALRNAILGRVAGWNTFLELNTPSVRNADEDSATTTAAAASAGASSVSITDQLSDGQYFTIAGDMTPLRVASTTGTGPYTTNLQSRNLKYAVANSATVTPFTTALVNQSTSISAGQTHGSVSDGYPSGWVKEIVYDGSGTPKVGQLVSFVTSGGTVLAAEYGIVQVDTANNTILLDRPLENDIDDDAVICLGPSGDYNFGYQREALTLVNRPLALPPDGTGARSAAETFENMSLRVVMTYDGKKQGTRVVVDGLFGVKVLDTARGGVLLG